MAKRRSTTERKAKPDTERPVEAESDSGFPLGPEGAGGPERSPRQNEMSMDRRGHHSMSEVEFNARVARKAFELFERRGGDSGRDVEDWLEAERLVKEDIRKETRS